MNLRTNPPPIPFIDVAAQRRMPDWRKALATARVHIETELQHQLERRDIVCERRGCDQSSIVGG